MLGRNSTTQPRPGVARTPVDRRGRPEARVRGLGARAHPGSGRPVVAGGLIGFGQPARAVVTAPEAVAVKVKEGRLPVQQRRLQPPRAEVIDPFDTHAAGSDVGRQRIGEGIQCAGCHGETPAEHPPAPVEIRADTEYCGICHTTTLGEWRLTGRRDFVPAGLRAALRSTYAERDTLSFRWRGLTMCWPCWRWCGAVCRGCRPLRRCGRAISHRTKRQRLSLIHI